MPDYTDQALHRRAAEFYGRIAVGNPDEWKEIQDLTPQLRGFEHHIRGNDCRWASDVVEAISFHLLAWGFFGRLIEMRQRLKDKMENGACDEPLDFEKRIANEGGLGLACLFSGRPDEASVYFMRAHLDAKTEAGKSKKRSDSWKKLRAVEGMWLGYLAWSEAYKGQIAEGNALFKEALEIAGETGDKLHGAFWRNELGWLNLDYYQDPVAAHAHLSASVSELNNLGKSNEAKRNRVYFYPNWALGETDLGRAYALLGHLDKAADHFLLAIDKFRAVRHRRWGRGLLPGNIGSLLREKGYPEKAKQIYELVLGNEREIGDIRGEQIVSARLGNVHRDLAWKAFLAQDRKTAVNELELAIQNIDTCVSLASDGKDLKRVIKGLRRLGNVHRELCRFYRGSKNGAAKQVKALELSERYHQQAHRLAPESFTRDGEGTDSEDRDDLRENLYDWLEQTRLNLEKSPADAMYPEVTQALLKQKQAEVPIVMGLVLLRDNKAYSGQGHQIASAEAAFAAAVKLAEKETKQIDKVNSEVRDVRRRLKLRYAIATANVGLAVTGRGKDRARYQTTAENQFRTLIEEMPSPDVIRDVCIALLMMQDPFAGKKDGAAPNAVIESALDILKVGMAGGRFEEGSSEQQLFEQCRSLFSA